MIENFKYGNISDTGSAGTVNEDYYGCFETINGKIFVLCDGTGNPIGGHVASKTAVEAVREYYNVSVYNNLIISLHNALVYANNAVRRKIQEEPELNGMSTTCLIVIINANKVYYADIGDSRLYHYRSGKCFVLSGKYSGTNESELLNTSTLQPGREDSTENPEKKVLGPGEVIDAHICNGPLQPEAGDLLLLCSAGLEPLVVENFGTPIIYNKKQDLQMRVADLVKLADKNRTADNTTLQLIEFDPGNEKINNEPILLNTAESVVVKRVAKESRRAPVVLPIILLLLIGAVIYFGFNHLKKEETAVTVRTETNTDTAVTKAAVVSKEMFEDSSLSAALIQAESNNNNIPVPKNLPQLPPVNPGLFSESGVIENTENPLPSSGRIPTGSGEGYIYTIQPGDDANTLKRKFRKTWEQLKSEDYNYTEAVPAAGKQIKIYGYIFFASGSDRERNENIENALKSSPGLQRPAIIIVPDGILIP